VKADIINLASPGCTGVQIALC